MRTFRGLLGVGVAACVAMGCLLMMGAGEAMALRGGALAAISLVEQPFATTDVVTNCSDSSTPTTGSLRYEVANAGAGDTIATVTDTTLSGNASGTACPGGGVFNSGTLTVTNSTLSDNSNDSGGGGIYNESGSVNVTDSLLSGNTGYDPRSVAFSPSGGLLATANYEHGLVSYGSVSAPRGSGAIASQVHLASVESAEWSQLGYGPGRTGYQPDETTIGPGNVGSLTAARTYATGGSPSPPLIVDGILYADSGNQLQAFDATGMTDCSTAPVSCTPLWTAATAYFDGMAIANGEVFVTDGEGVQAFDAAGSTDCSGTPTVCSPLWATSTHEVHRSGVCPRLGLPRGC